MKEKGVEKRAGRGSPLTQIPGATHGSFCMIYVNT